MRRAGRLTASPTLRSLRVRNFRLFFVGQTVSQAGTWMQSVALTWAVLDNGGDGLALGIATAVQFAPGLLLGPLCGLLIDRLDTHRLLVASQVGFTVVAVALTAVSAAGALSRRVEPAR